MRRVLLLLAVCLCFHASTAMATQRCFETDALYDEAAISKDTQRLRVLQWQIQVIESEFPFIEEQAFSTIRVEYPEEKFPMVTDAFITDWLHSPNTNCASIRGEKRYFHDLARNVGYRNFSVARRHLELLGVGSPFYDQVQNLVFPPARSGIPPKTWQAYNKPVRYLANIKLDIPRKLLPAKGTVRVWMPIPITTASQKNVRVISVEPEELLLTRPRVDSDLGHAVFDFPLEGRTDNVRMHVLAQFDSYTQAFQMNPKKVLNYDKRSATYQKYTRSDPNITITPELVKAAKKASKGEQNPYLAAKNIYQYILEHVLYSLTPHGTLMILGKPEATWVHEHGFGDCGAQSMYFAALCRALGIPARATGGFQLFPGFSGTHFWAEVYIEGYGWLPVDLTVADAADWTGAINEQQRKKFKEYYFGNMDPFRMVIQKDVDIQFTPEPTDNWVTGQRPLMVLQMPWMDCPEYVGTQNSLDLLSKYYSWKVVPVNR